VIQLEKVPVEGANPTYPLEASKIAWKPLKNGAPISIKLFEVAFC